jgi:hypothetical protein
VISWYSNFWWTNESPVEFLASSTVDKYLRPVKLSIRSSDGLPPRNRDKSEMRVPLKL